MLMLGMSAQQHLLSPPVVPALNNKGTAVKARGACAAVGKCKLQRLLSNSNINMCMGHLWERISSTFPEAQAFHPLGQIRRAGVELMEKLS